jgi:pilus assembly protein CpaB
MRMSRILLLLVALVAGGLAAYLATRGGGEAPAPATPEVVQEARTQILVATMPIGVGQRLSPTNMAWQDWPANAIRDGYIEKAALPEGLTDMQGAVARFEIFEGDPIRQQRLVKSEQGYLSAVLDKGKRGVSFSVNAASASGGFIVPNDHVDVVLTRTTEAGDMTAETILTNVRVLAINTRLGETGTTGAPADPENPRAEIFADTAIATVELDPIQAETIINASQLGRLSLSLRSIVDFAPNPDELTLLQRNAPIKIIRYGLEANVMAGTNASAATVDPASYSPETSSPVTDVPAPLLD